jgi:hypothetical protein
MKLSYSLYLKLFFYYQNWGQLLWITKTMACHRDQSLTICCSPCMPFSSLELLTVEDTTASSVGWWHSVGSVSINPSNSVSTVEHLKTCFTYVKSRKTENILKLSSENKLNFCSLEVPQKDPNYPIYFPLICRVLHLIHMTKSKT